MGRAVGPAVVLACGLLNAAFGSGACSSPSGCKAVGCSESESLTFSVPQASLPDSVLVVCRNADCWRAAITLADRQTPWLHPDLALEPDTGSVSAQLGAPSPADFTFVVGWLAPAQKGDVLSATFDDTSGNALVSKSGVTDAFTDDYPNGPECDKTPCHIATVDLGELTLE
jgi:hypothetical protein